jgi:hypothetical protein
MTTSPPVRRRWRRLVLVAAAVLLGLVGGVAAWLLFGPRAAAPEDRRVDPADVAAALDRLAEDPGSLVAAQSGPEAAAAARSAVPEGTEVTADPASWLPDGAGGGLMEVRLDPPDGEPATYVAVMVREATGWKVLATLPLEETAGSPAAGSPAAEPTS